MASNQQINISVRLDTEKIGLSVKDVSLGISKLSDVVTQMQNQVVEGFKTSIQELQQSNGNAYMLNAEFLEASRMVITTLHTSATSIVVELKNILSLMQEIKALDEQITIEEIIAVSANVTTIVTGMNAMLGLLSMQNLGIPGQFPSPFGGYSSAANSNVGGDGLVSNAMGGISGLLPDGMSADTVGAGMDTVIGKLQETTKAWAAQTAAKVADLAEDAKIIAMNTVEHAKAFGTMVVQMAKTTAAWVAETAAKVASTAAQWAQVAATTAWQAICVAATAVTTAFGAAVAFLASPIGIAIVAITALIAIVVLLVKNWNTVSAAAAQVWGFVQQKFEEFDLFLQNVFAQNWTKTFGAFGHVLNAFFANVENIWNAVKTIFDGIVGFVKNVFAGNWKGAWVSIKQILSGVWDGIMAAVKTPINSIIGFINCMVSGVVSGVNTIIRALNGLSFTVPDWVPVFGGSKFGFNIRQLTAPQIPYLAKGAVLPANRPFLAVVGDQRHGTNIEAPLATIQEAVAVVMEDHISAMMSGFQALLEENRMLRQTVAAIEVGDDTIGQAAARYNSKMAIVRGGLF